MSAPATVPVTITPEAAARVAELGMQAELERMIEHARQSIPGLRRVEVIQFERYDLGGEPGVSLEAYSDQPLEVEQKAWWDWVGWEVTTFPPEVCEHLSLSIRHEG
jgi:hypothetical protein